MAALIIRTIFISSATLNVHNFLDRDRTIDCYTYGNKKKINENRQSEGDIFENILTSLGLLIFLLFSGGIEL